MPGTEILTGFFQEDIDGDVVVIDTSLSNITPDTSPPEVTLPNELGAILKGIDNTLATIGDPDCATKSDSIVPASFTGTPKKYPVVFATTYPDADYTPIISFQTGDAYTHTIESQTAAGFTINLNSNTTPTSNVKWSTLKDDCSTIVVPGSSAHFKIVADDIEAAALTELQVGDGIVIQRGSNEFTETIIIESTTDGTLANSTTNTLDFNANAAVSDNMGGGNAVTAIPSNNTLVDLKSNGSILYSNNFLGVTVSSSQRLRFIESTNDAINFRRFHATATISFEGALDSVYRFTFRSKRIGGVIKTLVTGSQVTALGAGKPVTAVLNAQRPLEHEEELYIIVERLSGGGTGDITLKEMWFKAITSTWKTNT